MNAIFGVPTTTLMAYLLVLFALCLAITGWVWLRHRVVFKLGVRNISRRPAQTILIVIGLMLSTLIISAAFTTGDTLDHSIRSEVYDLLGPVDEVIVVAAGPELPSQPQLGASVPEHIAVDLATALNDNANVDGVLPLTLNSVPVVNLRTRLSEPSLIMTGLDPASADAFGGLRNQAGEPIDLARLPGTGIVLGQTPADKLDAVVGDQLVVYINNIAHLLTVEAIDEDSPLTGMLGFGASGGFAMPLLRTQTLTESPFSLSTIAISNTGGVEDGVRLSEQVTADIDAALHDTPYRAVPLKQDGLDTAEANGSLFVSMFLIFGMFSIAVGILLIFLIFTMLAAERKPEMGMARAVGLKRRQLSQMFVAEGMAYDLVSALVGAALGVGVAFVMAGMLSSFIGDAFDITPTASTRSLVIAYTLGIVVTFITILVSSWRVSRLSIVQAIRDISEPRATRESRRWLAFGIIGLLIGALMTFRGGSGGNAFLFYTGMSLVPLGLAAILRSFGAPARPVYSIAALIVLVLWLLPDSVSGSIFPETSGGIEMFFISGIMLVAAGTMIIIWNAEAITNAVGLLGKGFSRWLPALKTAIAYPLANRMRTGMTIAMFSLVVFSLVMMAAITANIVSILSGEHAGGGWDIRTTQATTNPISDFELTLSENGADPGLLDASARASWINPSRVQMRMADADQWKIYSVNGVDAAFISESNIPLQARAVGYDSDRAVWDALAADPLLAVIDSMALPATGFDPDSSEFTIDGVTANDKTMQPQQVAISDPATGKTQTVTVIGIIDSRAFTMWGMFLQEQTVADVWGMPDAINYYLRLAPGVNADDAARTVESALINYGVQADSIRSIVDETMAAQRNMMQLFEGFMALGLIVGIAALGVIAFRSVVERRQQIGMLRAIGYKRSMVAASFLIESTMITLLGVLSGTILGILLAWNLITSDYFIGGGGSGFIVPWLEMALFIVISLLASLLMAYIPARRAASVPIARALHYE